MAHEGSFEGARGFYDYEIIDWKHLDETEKHGTAEDLSDRNLHNVDEVTVRITNTETGQVSYQTVQGPFDDWEFVEEVLERDYGGEGSRIE